MSEDTVVGFRKPEEFADSPNERLRTGARRPIAEAGFAEFLAEVEERKVRTVAAP